MSDDQLTVESAEVERRSRGRRAGAIQRFRVVEKELHYVVMRDTSAAAFDRYHELLRGQAPHERLAQATALTRAVRELAVAGIRQRHPNASETEVRIRLVVRLYGRPAARRLFGQVPADAV